MSEKPEAVVLADDFDRAAKRELFRYLDLDKAAAELRRQHADNERLRGLLAEAQKAVWMNYDGDLLDRIEAALKEVPR